MLIRPHDAARDDEEWRAFLRAHDFGQLILPGAGRDLPVVVPTHFALDGSNRVLLHLATPNPAFDALAERPRALLAVIGAYAYVPSDWNAGEESPPEWGVPTSYYASVQLGCNVEVVDEPEGIAEILSKQLAHHEPERGAARVAPGENPYARQFGAIRGLRLTITDVRAKFKFGGNRPLAHRLRVAERLAERGSALDLEARRILLERSGDR